MASTTAAGQPVEGFNDTKGRRSEDVGCWKIPKKAKGKKEHICIKRLLLRFLTTIRHGFLIAERYVKWFDCGQHWFMFCFGLDIMSAKGKDRHMITRKHRLIRMCVDIFQVR